MRFLLEMEHLTFELSKLSTLQSMAFDISKDIYLSCELFVLVGERHRDSVKGTGLANFFNRHPSFLPLPLPPFRFDHADVGNVGYPVTIRQ